MSKRSTTRANCDHMKLPSGTRVTLLFLLIIVIGGVIAVRPRVGVSREVRQLARRLPDRMREAFPDWELFVRTRPCRSHQADLTVYVTIRERPAHGTLPEGLTLPTLEKWLQEKYPEVFLEEAHVTIEGTSKTTRYEHYRS